MRMEEGGRWLIAVERVYSNTDGAGAHSAKETTGKLVPTVNGIQCTNCALLFVTGVKQRLHNWVKVGAGKLRGRTAILQVLIIVR